MHIDAPEQQHLDLDRLFGDVLVAEATARNANHENRAVDSRVLKEGLGGDLVGIFGEWEGGKVFKVPLTIIEEPDRGDDGWDFVLALRFTVDVKCFRQPYNLIVEQGDIRADIYILAGFQDEPMRARLIGWEYASVIRRAPVRDFGHGKINHYIPAEKLRPIEQLLARQMHLR